MEGTGTQRVKHLPSITQLVSDRGGFEASLALELILVVTLPWDFPAASCVRLSIRLVGNRMLTPTNQLLYGMY